MNIHTYSPSEDKAYNTRISHMAESYVALGCSSAFGAFFAHDFRSTQ